MPAATRWLVLLHLALALVGTYYVYDMPAALNRQLQAAMGVSKADWQPALAHAYSLYNLPGIVVPFVSAVLVDRIVTGATLFSAGVHLASMPGEAFGVAQARLTCNWFVGPELPLALGINLASSRLGSVLNDILSPALARLPGPDFARSPEQERLGTLLAVWCGTLFCVVSALAAVFVVIVDRAHTAAASAEAASIPTADRQDQPADPGAAALGGSFSLDPHELPLHRTSSQNLRAGGRIYASRASGSFAVASSVASSHVSDYGQQQTVVRKWWSPSTDNLAAIVNSNGVANGVAGGMMSTSSFGDLHPNAVHARHDVPHLSGNQSQQLLSNPPRLSWRSTDQHESTISLRTPLPTEGTPVSPTPPDHPFHAAVGGRQSPAVGHPRATHPRIDVLPLVAEETHGTSGSRTNAHFSPQDRPSSPEAVAASTIAVGPGTSQDAASLHTLTLAAELRRMPIEFWLLVSLMVIYYACTVSLINVLGDELQNLTVLFNDARRASWLLAAPDLLSTLLMPVCGSFVQYRGRRIVILAATGLLLALVHAAFALSDPTMIVTVVVFIAGVIVLGVVYALNICVFWALIGLIVDESLQATAYATATASLNLGLAVFPLLAARLIKSTDIMSDYSGMHYMFVAIAIFGALVLCPTLLVVDQKRNNGLINMRGDVALQHAYHRIDTMPDYAHADGAGYEPHDFVYDRDMHAPHHHHHDDIDDEDDEDDEDDFYDDRGHGLPARPDIAGARRRPRDHIPSWVMSAGPLYAQAQAEHHALESKLHSTQHWLTYGTMYGRLVDEEQGVVVSSSPSETTPLYPLSAVPSPRRAPVPREEYPQSPVSFGQPPPPQHQDQIAHPHSHPQHAHPATAHHTFAPSYLQQLIDTARSGSIGLSCADDDPEALVGHGPLLSQQRMSISKANPLHFANGMHSTPVVDVQLAYKVGPLYARRASLS